MFVPSDFISLFLLINNCFFAENIPYIVQAVCSVQPRPDMSRQVQEKFEAIKEVIRIISKSKNRQYNGQKKMDKRTMS